MTVDASNFTPYSALLGGALIGLAATLLLQANGRVAGISGIVGGLLPRTTGETESSAWRATFVVGLLAGGLLFAIFRPSTFGAPVASAAVIAIAGLLVGIGTELGSGCTSGHGVCGISRFSSRSLVATLTFMLTGALATFVVRHVFGGAP
ncbi:MAG: YeeE/YedE thiosulfate transporter family protein [Polyangiaceae bacterium]